MEHTVELVDSYSTERFIARCLMNLLKKMKIILIKLNANNVREADESCFKSIKEMVNMSNKESIINEVINEFQDELRNLNKEITDPDIINYLTMALGKIYDLSKSKNNIIKKKNGKYSSGYKGVSLNKLGENWEAYIQHNNRRVYIGAFESELKAAKAFNEFSFFIDKEYAVLNDLFDDGGIKLFTDDEIQEKLDYVPEPIQKKSKYKGVSRNEKTLKWTARALYNGKTKHIGSFQTEKDAALAYNEFLIENDGNLKLLNKIE
jgi:hypothetical protein